MCAILKIPQIILQDEGVGVAALFELHARRQEWGVNEGSVLLCIRPVRFFVFRGTAATRCQHRFHSKSKEFFRVWSFFLGCLVFGFFPSLEGNLVLGQTLINALFTYTHLDA